MKRVLVSFAILAFALTPLLQAQTTNAAPVTNAPAATPPNPFPNAIAPEQVSQKAEAALAKYPEIDATETDSVEIDVRQAMDEKSNELETFADNTTAALAQNPSLDTIRSLENHGTYLAAFPTAWTSSLTDRTTQLGKELDQIRADQATWKDTLSALKAPPPASPDLVSRANDVLARLQAVKRETTARQSALFSLETEVTEKANLVTQSLGRLATARTRAVSELYVTNAPAVWSGSDMPSNNQVTKMSWHRQWQLLVAYIGSEPGKFVIHGLLFVLLVGIFFWLRGVARSLTAAEPGIAPAAQLFERPVSAGALLALFAGSFLYFPVAPRLLLALIGAIALIPSVVLLRHLIERRLFPVLYALVIFFFLEEFRSVASFAPAAERAFLLAEILGAISFLAWLLLSLRRKEGARSVSHLMRLGGWITFAALAAGWLADILGYTLLANLICSSIQRAATLGLGLYAGIRVVQALLFIVMRLRPISQLSVIQGHRPVILMRTQRTLGWAAGLWWAFLVLAMIPSSLTLTQRLFGSAVGRTGGWLGHFGADQAYSLNFGGKLIVAALTVWAAFQLSRFGRFVLETEFYPRLRLSAGIPYAISMTIHYVMLTIAFIGATAVLGIDMTKFTILVSALGVGVGFGLQNIINNFVSGLILLFERPVKIGDSVQTGDAAGVVERIGIRASVLRTAGGTEVIVPNGSLISNNVTNWTLSSQERIILIPLNVPRGPDVAHLIDLLMKTAAAHPKVLKNPPPHVQAQTLGANLGLELRAWTRAVDDWGQVRSDIVLAINEALSKENITLA